MHRLLTVKVEKVSEEEGVTMEGFKLGYGGLMKIGAKVLLGVTFL